MPIWWYICRQQHRHHIMLYPIGNRVQRHQRHRYIYPKLLLSSLNKKIPHSGDFLLFNLFQNQTGVCAAKPERIADGDINLALFRHIRHQIEITNFIFGVIQIDGRRKNPAVFYLVFSLYCQYNLAQYSTKALVISLSHSGFTCRIVLDIKRSSTNGNPSSGVAT